MATAMDLATSNLESTRELQAGWRVSPSIALLGQLLSLCYRVVFWALTLVTYHVPRWTIAILSWGGVISLEFNFIKLFLVFLAVGIAINWTIKARYLNKYSKLRETPLRTDEKLDLHPDVAAEASSGGINNYLDEFLSAIKVFGYLERPVFHELARHLQTRRLLAGETLSLDSADFYVVVDGTMQVYADIKDTPAGLAGDFDEDPEDNGFQLLNEVETGGTLSSLFTILRLFTEDVSLRYEENQAEDAASRSRRNDRDVPAMQLDLNPRNSPIEVRRRASVGRQQARVPSRLRNSFSSDNTVTDPAVLNVPPRPEIRFPEPNGTTNYEQALLTDDDPEDPIPDWRDTTSSGNRPNALDANTSEGRGRAAAAGPTQATVARAKVDSTLAVLPAEAFKRLTHKFPKASAHIVQVILTRLHRVTFLTAHEYLGLTKELVKTEKAINELACYPLPAGFYETGGIERLRQRFLPETKAVDKAPNSPEADYFSERRKSSYPLATPYHGPQMGKNMHTDSSFDLGPDAIRMRALSRNSSKTDLRTPPTLASPGPSRSREGSASSSFSASRVSRNVGDLLSMTSLDNTTNLMSHSPEKGSIALPDEDESPGLGKSARKHISFALGEADKFDLREEVMTCISKSIGLIQQTASVAPSAEASPVLHSHDGSLQRAVFSSSFGSLSYLGMQNRDDNTSVTSSSAAGAHDLPELENETEILFFRRDSTLVKAGEKGAGLFFVIEGFLDVLMPEGHIGYLEKAANPSPTRSEAPSRTTSPPPHISGQSGSRRGSRQPSRQSTPPLNAAQPAQKPPKVLFTVKPGGIAGYLSSLSGFSSYVDIKAKTDVYVGFLPAKALERIMDRRPIVLLTLAKRLISLLPPLVIHIDSALEWMQVNSGQVIHRQGDKADSFYFVNQGRLRAIAEKEGISGVEILAEFGQGDSVGELDCITATPRSSTLHAIRDSELTRMPMTLFNAISVRYPEITIKISRIIGQRVRRELDSRKRAGDVSGAELGKNNFNLKTVAILPVTYQVPVTEFATKLKAALEDIGAPASYLNQATVMHVQGRHAFSKMGKLKLAGWLAEQEQRYRIVLYVADTAVSSPWTQTCIKQADCILLVAHGAAEPTIGEYERLLVGMKTTARKELVLLHSDRAVPPGSTRPWLQARPWIHAWSHCELANVPAHPHVSEDLAPVTAIKNLRHKVQMQIGKYRRIGGTAPQVHRPATMSDFARLARRLCGKSIGVVLGGGGARGLSHIGALRALADAGIPVDMVGGTSIGSFIGGLYAREGDLVSTLGRAKRFSGRMSSTWRMLTDVTYPIVAYTTGHEFNRGIYKSFYDYHIEDMWLTFFCNTTNITHSRMDVHYTGYVWRYVRASMTLVGLLPPLSDEGNMLVDGGYTDNLPVSTMLALGAASVFAVDVGSIDDTSPREFGESVSGWWVLLNRWNPWSKTRFVPTITEIQSRLTYVSSVKTLEDAKTTPGVLYMRMPVEQYGTMHFNKFTEIMEAGYKASEKMLKAWSKQGKIPTGMVEDDGKLRQSSTGRPGAGKPIRRNSI